MRLGHTSSPARTVLAAILASLGLVSATPPPRAAAAEPAPASSPHVVSIDVGAEDASDTAPRPGVLGFVTESTGFVVTAYAPLVDAKTGRLAESIRIRPRGERRAVARSARVIGVEPTLGFAVLQIEDAHDLEPSRLRRDAAPEPGTPLFAPTRADGTDPGTLAGTLTALNTRECYQESLTSTLYQAALPLPLDAAGAPVYTGDGEIVAIYTGAMPEDGETHEEIEGSIHILPITLVQNIYDSLKQKKSLRSPWTGFSVRPLTIAEARRFPTEKGFRSGIGIEYVWPGSPAAKLGIRPGDVLLQFSHNPIASVADFQKWLYLYGAETKAQLVFLRGETEHLVTEMTIEERPAWAKPR
jgi:S1-C subfamily serine protease